MNYADLLQSLLESEAERFADYTLSVFSRVLCDINTLNDIPNKHSTTFKIRTITRKKSKGMLNLQTVVSATANMWTVTPQCVCTIRH